MYYGDSFNLGAGLEALLVLAILVLISTLIFFIILLYNWITKKMKEKEHRFISKDNNPPANSFTE